MKFPTSYNYLDSPVSLSGEMSRAVAAANYGFEQQLSPALLNNASACEPQVPMHSMSPERVQVPMMNGMDMDNSPATSSEGDSRGNRVLSLLRGSHAYFVYFKKQRIFIAFLQDMNACLSNKYFPVVG